ncbi:MAG: hypothetical protein AB7P01_16350 [Bacteroidia bacterium]
MQPQTILDQSTETVKKQNKKWHLVLFYSGFLIAFAINGVHTFLKIFFSISEMQPFFIAAYLLEISCFLTLMILGIYLVKREQSGKQKIALIVFSILYFAYASFAAYIIAPLLNPWAGH